MNFMSGGFDLGVGLTSWWLWSGWTIVPSKLCGLTDTNKAETGCFRRAATVHGNKNRQEQTWAYCIAYVTKTHIRNVCSGASASLCVWLCKNNSCSSINLWAPVITREQDYRWAGELQHMAGILSNGVGKLQKLSNLTTFTDSSWLDVYPEDAHYDILCCGEVGTWTTPPALQYIKTIFHKNDFWKQFWSIYNNKWSQATKTCVVRPPAHPYYC